MFLSIVSQIEDDLLPTDGTIRGWKLRVAFLSCRTAPDSNRGIAIPRLLSGLQTTCLVVRTETPIDI